MSNQPKFCSQCAASLRPGSKFCAACGATIGITAPSATPDINQPIPKWNTAAWLLPTPWLWRYGKNGIAALYGLLAVPTLFFLYATANWMRILSANWPHDAMTAERVSREWGVNFGLNAMEVGQLLVGWLILYLILTIPVGLKANRWAKESGQGEMASPTQTKWVAVGGTLTTICLVWGIYMSYHGYAAFKAMLQFRSQ